jgi:hypothetical protein
MIYLLFGCGFFLSAIAAYYAVMGLIAIFSTAVIPIAIMGSALEASKLVAASWLYRNWNTAPKLLKTYFTTAVVVLMILTSMGIFGYLSKAHLDQAVPTGDIVSKLSLIDEKIKTQKENIDAARKALTQLDRQVDQTLDRSSDEKGAANAVAIRQRQAKERTSLINEVSKAQQEIAKLNEERAPIASEVRKVEAEVGPIKYVAALIYGDTMDDSLLESSVRIVILMIVFVFDPLAVLLLIAANRESLLQKTKSDDDDDKEVNDWFSRGKERARLLDEEVDAQKSESRWNKIISSIRGELKPGDLNYDPYTGMSVVFQPTSQPKEDWDPTILQGPPIEEPPEEFKKVVKEYFSKKDEVKEPMLFVNEEPESKFILNPDFNPKDPFEEKNKGSVRPNSRRHPE